MRSYTILRWVLLFSLVVPLVGAGHGASWAVVKVPLTTAASARLYPFADGTTIVPMGAAQGHPSDRLALHQVYEQLFAGLYDERWNHEVVWTASSFTADGTGYDPGTLLAPISSPYFTSTVATTPFTVTRSLALQPVKIGVFYPSLRDEFDQTVAWEEGDFEQLFRVYLWGDYMTPLSETQVISGELISGGYQLFILPSLRIGYAEEVADLLDSEGLTALREWVEAGGTLYAQGEACYLLEAAGLVDEGTVDLTTRVTDPDNRGELVFDSPDHPLAFSWAEPATYVLNEPLLNATSGLTVVAHYSDTTAPGSPALMAGFRGDGKIVLMSGHPSDKLEYYPQVLNVVLWAMSRRAGLKGTLQQGYSPVAPPDVVPAYEAGVPVMVTTTLANYWDGDLALALVTETVEAGFVVDTASISPTGSVSYLPDGRTQIIWGPIAAVAPGDSHFTYVVRTLTDTLASGEALVSRAEAFYRDPYEGNGRRYLVRKPLYLYGRMAARLEGDRDIELDGLYPLPAEGYYFDLALTLENKEETAADRVLITDVVPLLSPIVDVDDQRKLVHVLTDTVGTGSEGESLWAYNEVFFYENATYPLPTVNGVPATVSTTYNLSTWDGTTVYTFTGSFTTTPGLSNTVTIPAAYSDTISLTPEGLVLPAVVLEWDLGSFPGYDWEEPTVRYGLFSRELFSRTVSFASDPITTSALVASGGGGSVYAALGGDPIPYHEYLSSGIVHVPEWPVQPRVSYVDLWGREHILPLRTVFYDIVPFPPPEYHAVVNTTFELLADWDGDGVYDEVPLDFPARSGADVHFVVKSHSNFAPPLDMRKDETLIRLGLFKGLGVTLAPKTGEWETSWSCRNLQGHAENPTAWLTETLEFPGHDVLFFQQDLDAQAYETIDITGTLAASEGVRREGTMKLHDGARFVYHQKALGPSRYEVYDSHVQALFGVRADLDVSKRVAPVLVATYEDQVYHFIRIEDLGDPREFSAEPFLRSYGFGESAATVYVGGREGRSLLSPKVAPGGHTRIRVEINNNTGMTWTNVVLTPTAPAGFTVTPVTFTEQMETPIFFDFPFLNVDEVPDAWRGVYYFDVDVADPFPLERGKVYSVTFEVGGENLPAGFAVPPALIGVTDEGGHAKYSIGHAVQLMLNDLLPPLVTPEAARWGTASEADDLVHAIITDTTPTHSEIDAAFNALDEPVSFVTSTVSSGTQVAFDLTGKRMPWPVGGEEQGTMYVVLRSRTAFYESGTNTVNEGPVLSYLDDFNRPWVAEGNAQTVEVHGAVIEATYSIDGVEDISSGEPLNGVQLGTENAVTVTITAFNRGDYIAHLEVVTTELAAGVVISSSSLGYVQAGQVVSWTLTRDLAPADSEAIRVTLVVTPTGPAGGSVRLLERTGARFEDRYPPAQPEFWHTVDRLLLGPLNVGTARQIYRVYLPAVLRQTGTWWPQSTP